MVNKQMYKYFRQVHCSHMIYAMVNGKYEPDVEELDSENIGGSLIETAQDLIESGQKIDPIMEYFATMGYEVERAFGEY